MLAGGQTLTLGNSSSSLDSSAIRVTLDTSWLSGGEVSSSLRLPSSEFSHAPGLRISMSEGAGLGSRVLSRGRMLSSFTLLHPVGTSEPAEPASLK